MKLKKSKQAVEAQQKAEEPVVATEPTTDQAEPAQDETKPARYGDIWPPKREPAKLPTGWPGSKPEQERKSGFYSKV